MIFNECYFDTSEDVPIWDTHRARTSVRLNNCHMSGLYGNVMVRGLTNMGKGPIELWGETLSYGVHPYCAVNLIPNGDLAAAPSSRNPVYSYNTAIGADQVGQGIYDRFHRITQSKTVSNTVYLGRVLAPFRGVYTAQAIVRNGGVGSKTVRWCFNAVNDNYGTVTINDSDWSFITMTINETQPLGQDLRVGFFTDDATSFTLDLLYVCITAGTDVPFFMKAVV